MHFIDNDKGSLQIHNAITGSLRRRNLNIFKEAFKLGNLIHEMNQVGQLLNVVRDVHFESEAAEKQQILILLNDRRAVCSGFNGRKWKHSKDHEDADLFAQFWLMCLKDVHFYYSLINHAEMLASVAFCQWFDTSSTEQLIISGFSSMYDNAFDVQIM
ncbi:Interleukin-36 gamma [Trichinella pseudospiralis]